MHESLTMVILGAGACKRVVSVAAGGAVDAGLGVTEVKVLAPVTCLTSSHNLHRK